MIDDFSIGDKFDGKKISRPFSKWEKYLIIGIILAIVFIISIVIIIVLATGSQSNDDNDKKSESEEVKDKIGEIYCIYEINSINNPVSLLGNEYNKNSDFDIYINGELIKFSKEYIFKETGKYNIKYSLYNDLSMDYMFKDVSSLKSVDMISEKNAEIKSMISAFENCENLNKFSISGFITNH